jgi:FlaA1/EpsC-like NDP-sugar epimerase
MPTASGKTIREIVSICESVQVQTKIIPGIYELLGGTVRVNQLRDVEIEDLLRREPVQTDIAAVKELIQGKRVLITGSGGSIGRELCRQVFRCGPAELILLGHGENSIFAIHNELNQLGHSLSPAANGHKSNGTASTLYSSIKLPRLVPVIADIRFLDRLQLIFEQYRPEIVFHAAAHKHVPLMEANPAEAVTNNIIGTRNLLTAALAVDVQRFVMISTDKAVNPTNIMGASKRAAELLVHRAGRESGRPYVAVRFGNVLGSNGSVVLTFKQQIAAGGPVTVTHPDMRRYFMTIPEAVQLVLQAATLGKGDEVFILDMGEPVKIVDLARDLIELSGLEVGRDIDIVFTSPRPGDKLFEELFINGEKHARTCHEKIFISKQAGNFIPSNSVAVLANLAAAA